MDTKKPKIILYVEDDPVVLTAYRYRLERVGYGVESAKDGLEAMKVLSRRIPDLIILDLMMPKFDGAEVLKFMRSNPRLKNIPVIILSTNSITDASEEYLLECASRRLIKDKCTFPMLLRAVTELLSGPAANGNATPESQNKNGRSGRLPKDFGLN